jgi:hypothetical protein
MLNGAFVTVIEAEPDTFVNPACVDVALQVPVPVPEGVNTPPCVMVPPVAVHVTPVLKAPVPFTVATQVDVCEVVMLTGLAMTEMLVTDGGGLVTVMFAEPEIFVKPDCAEVAMHFPVPVPDGVKTPPCVIVPPVAVQVTALLKVPVPVTVATHVDVFVVSIEAGVATTEIPVTLMGTVAEPMLMDALPDLLGSSVEVAVHIPVPVPEGVNTPACVMVPPEADHVTVWLKFPVPETTAVQVAVCPTAIEVGLAVTVTDVIFGPELPTFIGRLPDLFLSCFEVAVMVLTPDEGAVAGAV